MSLAAALECSPSHLLYGDAVDEKITYVGKVRPGLVPVVGDAVLGVDGMIDMVEYRGGWLKIYSDDPNAYGLRVRGDSMWPRIQSGEFVLIEPGSTIHPGDEVFVRTSDGHNMIKVLNYTRDGEYQFNSINQDHRPITMARAEVQKVQYVAGILKASRHVDNDTVTDSTL
ncbi:helix-turn-helix transcriptional regulator [Serratia rubidaea]|nr:helix-turn-helix transcriptional regulator [Serratia rubidaea]